MCWAWSLFQVRHWYPELDPGTLYSLLDSIRIWHVCWKLGTNLTTTVVWYSTMQWRDPLGEIDWIEYLFIVCSRLYYRHSAPNAGDLDVSQAVGTRDTIPRTAWHVSYLQTSGLIINLVSTLGAYQPLTAIVQMDYKSAGLLLAVQRRSGGD